MRVDTADPAVKVRGACHHYGPREVLHDIDLDLRAGEIYGLLGPNGAGKTTLMKALSGYLRLSQGTVRVGNGDPYTDRRARQAVSYIPQDIAIFPYLTVAENLEVFGRLGGVHGAELNAAVAGIVEKVVGNLKGGTEFESKLLDDLQHLGLDTGDERPGFRRCTEQRGCLQSIDPAELVGAGLV